MGNSSSVAELPPGWEDILPNITREDILRSSHKNCRVEEDKSVYLGDDLYDLDEHVPMALEILRAAPHLKDIRFKLVPSTLTEERYWAALFGILSDSTTRNVRWAILGTGCIANDMVQVLKQLPHTEVVAVGSRSVEGAKRFGDRWGIPRQYGSYEEAASDKDVDVCYVATPSLRHPQDCLLAIKHKKAVLCEKCMAPDHVVAKEVLDAAKASNLLFVHGVWSRFFPAMKKIREIIDSGEIGTVRSARASFCQNDGAGSCSALLETGIYCAQFLQWALGDPNNNIGEDGPGPVVRGACRTLHESGKDEHVTAIIEFPGNKIGSFECSLAHCSSRSASIYGSAGVIDVPFPFWCPTTVKVTKMTGLGSQQWSEPVIHEFSLPSDVIALSTENGEVPGFNFVNSTGLAYEAAEVNRCIREGRIESSSFSTQQCIEILRLISDISTYATK